MTAGSQAAAVPFAFVAPLFLPVPLCPPQQGVSCWNSEGQNRGFSACASVAQCCCD